MTSKINWRHAFYDEGGNMPRSKRENVISAVMSWSDWDVTTENGYITRIEDAGGDGIWDYEWGNTLDDHFSDRFLKYMDKTFQTSSVFVGKATILPLPVDNPSPSSKGVVSSSSF